jgi:hypothetical protein
MSSSSQAFDSWNSLNDSAVLDSSKTYRIQAAFSCPVGFGVGSTDVYNAFIQYFPSVTVSEDLQSRLDGMNNVLQLGMAQGFNTPDLWNVNVTVADGLTAGDCRAVAQQALNDMSSAKAVPCGNFAVGNISVLVPGVGLGNAIGQGIANATGQVAPVASSLKWVGIAIIAVVALFFFVQAKEAV